MLKTKLTPEQLQKIRQRYITSSPRAEDKDAWMAMWNDYAAPSKPPEPAILERTWRELQNPDGSFGCLFLYTRESSEFIGFLHYILHPDTWHDGLSCYVEDGYVVPAYRPKGAMAVLYEALIEKARDQKWEQLYWMTRAGNNTARRFYDRIATSTDWVRYEYNHLDKTTR